MSKKHDSRSPDYPPVTVAECRARVLAYHAKAPKDILKRSGPHGPSWLAHELFWPGRVFRSNQGAARAAQPMIKKLADVLHWTHRHGYYIRDTRQS